MSEFTKATLKLIIAALISFAGAARLAITASGRDDLHVFLLPSIWLDMFLAFGPTLFASLSKSPAQGAAMDKAIEKKADAKAEMKVEAIVDNFHRTGEMPFPLPRVENQP